MDADSIGAVLGRPNPAVWLVTAASEQGRGGLIATGVMSASIVAEMPRLLVGIGHGHATFDLIREAGCCGLHLLRPDQLDLVEQFGTRSGREVDKLADVPMHIGETGVPLLADSAGWLECRVEAAFDAGDRTFFLLEVVNGAPGNDVEHAGPPGAGIMSLADLLAAASPSMLAELRRQRLTDTPLDATAIARWRSQRQS